MTFLKGGTLLLKQLGQAQMLLLAAPMAGDILRAWLFEMFLGWENGDACSKNIKEGSFWMKIFAQ